MDIFTKHPQWNDVKKVCSKLHENGFTAWLAGGCVRDGLLGVTPKDFDIATNARPKKIESLFNKTVGVGKAFGVIRVVEPSGDIEVATFRKDGPYVDGRHPTSVELSSAEEDAKRRDFTVNALFYDIFENKIHDFVGGENDLKAKIIRTVGVPADRFVEDKLRVLRAVRFVAQLDFDLDPATYQAVCKFTPSVLTVSWERIRDELHKLITAKRPDRGIKLLHETGLIHVLLPEVNYSYVQNFEKLFERAVNRDDQALLGWMILLSAVPNADERAGVMKRLKFSNHLYDTVASALEVATSLQIFDGLDESEKRKVAAEPEAGAAASFLQIQGKLASVTEDFLKKNPKLPERFIEAGDILALGIKPGKAVGYLLEKAFDAQLDGRVKNRGEALQFVIEAAKNLPK